MSSSIMTDLEVVTGLHKIYILHGYSNFLGFVRLLGNLRVILTTETIIKYALAHLANHTHLTKKI
jgi:hypothetical protein